MTFPGLNLALPFVWLAAGAAAQALAASPRPEQRGRALLWQYQCGTCHAIPGVPASRGQLGPSLADWGSRSYIAGRLPNRPDVLVRWIVQPQALVPATPMPSMGVTPEDAEAMAAYLFSLQ